MVDMGAFCVSSPKKTKNGDGHDAAMNNIHFGTSGCFKQVDTCDFDSNVAEDVNQF